MLVRSFHGVNGSSFIYCDIASTNVIGEKKKDAVTIGHHHSFVVEGALMSYSKYFLSVPDICYVTVVQWHQFFISFLHSKYFCTF